MAIECAMTDDGADMGWELEPEPEDEFAGVIRASAERVASHGNETRPRP